MAVLGLWSIASSSGAQPATSMPPKSTTQVFANLYAVHLTEAFKQGALPKTLVFKPAPLPTFQGVLDAALQAKLIAEGFVLYERDSLEHIQEFATVESYAQQTDLSYEWIADGRAKRTFALQASCKVLHKDGRTLLVRYLNLVQQDTVQASDLLRLEDRRFPETFKVSAPSLWESAAVPVLVVSAIGIIVFLFFSVRSR